MRRWPRAAASDDTSPGNYRWATLEDLELSERRFDVVFAVRVRLFHRDPDRAHSLAKRWLAPGGVVRAFYDAPPERHD